MKDLEAALSSPARQPTANSLAGLLREVHPLILIWTVYFHRLNHLLAQHELNVLGWIECFRLLARHRFHPEHQLFGGCLLDHLWQTAMAGELASARYGALFVDYLEELNQLLFRLELNLGLNLGSIEAQLVRWKPGEVKGFSKISPSLEVLGVSLEFSIRNLVFVPFQEKILKDWYWELCSLEKAHSSRLRFFFLLNGRLR